MYSIFNYIWLIFDGKLGGGFKHGFQFDEHVFERGWSHQLAKHPADRPKERIIPKNSNGEYEIRVSKIHSDEKP